MEIPAVSVARGGAAGEEVWVKTLHQDYGRKEESIGFRRASYRATLGDYNTGGLSPSNVVPFLSSLRNLCS